MTTAEIADAKGCLKELKPNVLKLASQNNEVGARARGRLRVDRDHEPRHRRPRQGRRRPGRQAGVPEGGNRRVHRLRADGEGVQEPGRLRPASSTPCSRPRGSRRTSSRTGVRCSTRRRTRCSSTRATATAPHRLLYNQPEKALEDDAEGPLGQRAGVHRRLQRGVRRLIVPGRARVSSDPAGRHSAAAGSPRARLVGEPARRVRRLRPGAHPLRPVLPRPARADRLLTASGRPSTTTSSTTGRSTTTATSSASRPTSGRCGRRSGWRWRRRRSRS